MKAGPLVFFVPVRTVSTLNLREHWTTRSKRVADERDAVAAVYPEVRPAAMLEVRLIRCATVELDTDNLAAALKGVRDQVAAELHLDDRCPLVRWTPLQEPAAEDAQGVRVELESVGGGLALVPGWVVPKADRPGPKKAKAKRKPGARELAAMASSSYLPARPVRGAQVVAHSSACLAPYGAKACTCGASSSSSTL